MNYSALSLSSLSLFAASYNVLVNPSSIDLVQCGFIFCSVFLVFIQIGQLLAFNFFFFFILLLSPFTEIFILVPKFPFGSFF